LGQKHNHRRAGKLKYNGGMANVQISRKQSELGLTDNGVLWAVLRWVYNDTVNCYKAGSCYQSQALHWAVHITL